jgi:hypothetical protein
MPFPLRGLVNASLLLLVFVSGCGPADDGRRSVSGTITFQGKPLDRGNIMFVPPDGLGSQTGAVIANGTYEIPPEQGLLPGRYKVAISSADGDVPADPNTPPGPSGNFTSVDRIPKEYNTESKLEAEVKDQAQNVIDFTIP